MRPAASAGPAEDFSSMDRSDECRRYVCEKLKMLAVAAVVLVFCCSAALAVPAQNASLAWIKADMLLAETVNRQEVCVIQCGRTVTEFSQGRLTQSQALAEAKKTSAAADTVLSKAVKLDSSADAALYACGIDLVRSQAAQVKAAMKMLQRSDVTRTDILSLRSFESRVCRSQRRYMQNRRKSIGILLNNISRQQRTSVRKGSAKEVSTELTDFYKFEYRLLALQSEQLDCSAEALEVIGKAASGKTVKTGGSLQKKAGALSRKCRALAEECPSGLKELSSAYSAEFAAFEKFAEAVELMESDLSSDAVSRVNRTGDRLQKAEKKASALSAEYVKNRLP